MAHRELGETYYMQKDFAKAEAELLKAVADDPDGSAHYQLGLVYRAQGHLNDANKMFALTRQIKAERLSQAEVTFAARRTSRP
jgi:Tfp pilus assembly protein PilF